MSLRERIGASPDARSGGLPAVRLRDLGVAYPGSDRPALREVSLDVGQGAVLGVMGATGAGKTTLGLALDGLVPQLIRAEVTGELLVAGDSPRTTPVREMAKLVSIVLDAPVVGIAAGTVAEEVALGLEHQGLDREEMRHWVAWALGCVGLTGVDDRAPSTLSGGQRARLALAAAIATRPHVLFLDEPTAGLDPSGVRLLVDLLGRLRSELGTTVIVADHDADVVAALADVVVVLHDGRIVLAGSPDDVLDDAPSLSAYGVRLPARQAALWRAAAGIARRPPADLDAPVLAALDGVSYVYPSGIEALRGITLDVRAGEVLGVAGSNGSGKTTLTKLVDGLLLPTAGEVTVLDQVPDRPMAPWVGYVFQDPDHQLFAPTVEAELAFGPRNVGLTEAESTARAREVAHQLGLGGVLGAHPARLPRPLRKLVTLASVLAMRPRLLVLDEPTAGQDARTIARIEAAIREHRDGGGAVVVVSHDLGWLGLVADRLALLADGRLIGVGDAADVLADRRLIERADLQGLAHWVPRGRP